MRFVRPLPFLALLLASAPLSAQDNHVPGSSGVDPRNERQVYRTRIRHELDQLLQRWKDAWEQDNAGGVAELFTRDGVLVTSNGETVRGQRAIRDSLQGDLPALFDFQRMASDFDYSGDYVFETGEFTMQQEVPGGSPVRRSGTYVLIAERENGGDYRFRSQILTFRPAS